MGPITTKSSINSVLDKLLPPYICVMLFVLLQEVAVQVFADAASKITGVTVKWLHVARLPPLMRDVRSEAIYVVTALILIRMFSRIRGNLQLCEIGLSQCRLLSDVVLGFALQIAPLCAMSVMFLYIAHLHWMVTHDNFPLLGVLSVYFLTSVAEELIWRGYVFQMVDAYWGTGMAFLLSSVLFGLDHLMGSGVDIAEVFNIAVFGGVLFGAAYFATHRLWLAIGLHWGWDFGTGLFHGGYGFHALFNAASATQKIDTAITFLQLLLALILIYIGVRKGHWRGCCWKLKTKKRLDIL